MQQTRLTGNNVLDEVPLLSLLENVDWRCHRKGLEIEHLQLRGNRWVEAERLHQRTLGQRHLNVRRDVLATVLFNLCEAEAKISLNFAASHFSIMGFFSCTKSVSALFPVVCPESFVMLVKGLFWFMTGRLFGISDFHAGDLSVNSCLIDLRLPVTTLFSNILFVKLFSFTCSTAEERDIADNWFFRGLCMINFFKLTLTDLSSLYEDLQEVGLDQSLPFNCDDGIDDTGDGGVEISVGAAGDEVLVSIAVLLVTVQVLVDSECNLEDTGCQGVAYIRRVESPLARRTCSKGVTTESTEGLYY
ncbi:hypothetical protein MAR_036953 [Mya arenaria]|uniref:Uncharacterized protein n=1 Tax=Mya arenaria TaxID=6604 RepID=A0ABY7FR01_MYAAR|nr:hypothetical protein MAR_036953 [Mya arenaria]